MGVEAASVATLPEQVQLPRSSLVAIVDDDPDVRASLDSLMRSAGLAARCFGGAKDLLADEEIGAVSCVVTDLHMPEMTGLELQSELARRGWTRPVIFMTAFASDATRALALAAGAAAFLSKPIDPDALLDAIETAMH
ncbi:MAG TPA: response regulator [Geminicoccus sp.]|uniref:response regulator transcription factor n=1 Tax=Geminicoccus sp. TaxID=2024832 RepID=UPI002CE02208|nr:response regulator [Geminicoccus sp.]HWL69732.1 response regulator [Geminicoccus sp.]